MGETMHGSLLFVEAFCQAKPLESRNLLPDGPIIRLEHFVPHLRSYASKPARAASPSDLERGVRLRAIRMDDL